MPKAKAAESTEAKVKLGSTKNKDKVSKAVSVDLARSGSTGLPKEMLAELAKFGVVPRIDFDPVEMLDTTSPRLNWIMGGGLPISRLTTLSGKKKTGKTSISCICCAATLDADPDALVFYFDTENKFSIEWAESLGMDMNRFIFVPIETGEQLINVFPILLKNPRCRGIVIDSIRGTQWDAEANADAEAQQMGVGAKMWNKFARKMSGPIKNSKAWVLALNGVYQSMKANSNELIEPGGEGIPFMAGLRLRTRPLEMLDKNRVKITVACLQSQVGWNSENEGSVELVRVGGQTVTNPFPEIAALIKELELLPMKGSWFVVNEETDEKYNGETQFAKAMQQNEELFEAMYDLVMRAMRQKPSTKNAGDYVEQDEPQDFGIQAMHPEDNDESLLGIDEDDALDLFDQIMDDNEWVDPMGGV